jgi:hypothetical protein
MDNGTEGCAMAQTVYAVIAVRCHPAPDDVYQVGDIAGKKGAEPTVAGFRSR